MRMPVERRWVMVRINDHGRGRHINRSRSVNHSCGSRIHHRSRSGINNGRRRRINNRGGSRIDYRGRRRHRHRLIDHWSRSADRRRFNRTRQHRSCHHTRQNFPRHSPLAIARSRLRHAGADHRDRRENQNRLFHKSAICYWLLVGFDWPKFVLFNEHRANNSASDPGLIPFRSRPPSASRLASQSQNSFINISLIDVYNAIRSHNSRPIPRGLRNLASCFHFPNEATLATMQALSL